MALKVSVRFNPNDSPAQVAEKLNKMSLELMRSADSAKSKISGGSGSSGGSGGSSSSTIITQDASFSRVFLLMGA